MRLKYYLRGVGIGVFVTALLMTIAFAASGSGSSSLTDDEIIAKAEALGMVLADAADDTSSASDVDDVSDDTTTTDSSSANQSTTDEDVTLYDEDGNEVDTSELTTVEGEEEEEEVDSSDVYIDFEISAGQSSSTVCNNLYEAGLVDDADAFDTYLSDHGKDNSLRVGSYAIPAGVTYGQLAEILTTSQN